MYVYIYIYIYIYTYIHTYEREGRPGAPPMRPSRSPSCLFTPSIVFITSGLGITPCLSIYSSVYRHHFVLSVCVCRVLVIMTYLSDHLVFQHPPGHLSLALKRGRGFKHNID